MPARRHEILDVRFELRVEETPQGAPIFLVLFRVG
jgi:hypothetical protein